MTVSLSPYEKSRAINYGIGSNSIKDANTAMLRGEYAKSMAMALEYEPDALINGESRRIIARKAKGSQRYEIQSYPDETFYAGDIVDCYGAKWIIIEVNANKDIYTTGIMLRCNHLFKFQNGTSEIHERWGVLDTGVYSTTVKETETQTELNKQYKIYLPLDDETSKLYVGKRLATGTMKDSSYRNVLTVYRTTEFDDSSENYGDDALLILKCISDQYNQSTDNLELRICDYISPTPPSPPVETFNANITYSGDAVVRIGGSGKTFGVGYTNVLGQEVINVVTTWILDDDAPDGVTLANITNSSCKIVIDDTVSDGLTLSLTVRGNKDGIIASSTLLFEAVM